MVKRRLLMYFSYIGTNYRGLQRLVSKNPLSKRAPDLDSIQGVLEFGLQKVVGIDRLPIFTSSRTDTKVHALESTAVFDLYNDKEFRNLGGLRCPEIICQHLNVFLDKNECDIRVKRIVEVNQDFNCRRAFSRVYEYRLAILNEHFHSSKFPYQLTSATTIRELNRVEVIPGPFDIPAVQNACNVFLGEHDFSTFMKSTKEQVPDEKRVKTIKRFSFSLESIPHRDSEVPGEEGPKGPYDIYTFTVEGSGFLRRQVRRMVGALIAVGRGYMEEKDIIWMLKNPKEQNWNPKGQAAGPHGLYLKQINYSNLEVLRGYLS